MSWLDWCEFIYVLNGMFLIFQLVFKTCATWIYKSRYYRTSCISNKLLTNSHMMTPMHSNFDLPHSQNILKSEKSTMLGKWYTEHQCIETCFIILTKLDETYSFFHFESTVIWMTNTVRETNDVSRTYIPPSNLLDMRSH